MLAELLKAPKEVLEHNKVGHKLCIEGLRLQIQLLENNIKEQEYEIEMIDLILSVPEEAKTSQ